MRRQRLAGRRAQPCPRAHPYNLRTGTWAIEAASSGVSKRSGWAFVSGVGGATGLLRRPHASAFACSSAPMSTGKLARSHSRTVLRIDSKSDAIAFVIVLTLQRSREGPEESQLLTRPGAFCKRDAMHRPVPLPRNVFSHKGGLRLDSLSFERSHAVDSKMRGTHRVAGSVDFQFVTPWTMILPMRGGAEGPS